jgi:hypothetical protein
MRFFFYGTLMDCDLLSRVLGRPIAPSKLIPALLRGYRRSAVQGLPYPVVLREPTASVSGLVLADVTATERGRLRRHEGENYFLMQGVAEFGQEPARSVLLFVPKPGAFVATGEPWSLTRWRSHAKSKMLHTAVMALLLFTCEITPGLRPAEAATVSTTNPNYSAFSSRCSGNWDSDLSFDFVQLLARVSLSDVVSCQPDLWTNPLEAANAVESNPSEEFDNQLYRMEDRPDDHDFKHSVSIKELDADRGYSGADNCVYLDKNNQMLRADEDKNCGVFEPGFDYTQVISILTLSIIALLSFAAVPLAWLIYRYRRARRLGRPAAAGSGASQSRARRRRTTLPPLVPAPRQRVSSSSRGRHRHRLRKRLHADKGG